MDRQNPRLFLNEFALKIIGMVFMTLDHVGIFLLQNPEESIAYNVGYWFRIAGRIAFPLFLFMLAEGIRHTHDLKNYLLRLFGVYAVITIVESIAVYGFTGATFSPDGLDPEPFTDLVLCAATLAALSLPGKKKLWAILPIAILGLSFGCGVYDHFHEDNIILWFPRYLRAGYSLLGLAMALGFYYAPSLVKLAGKKMMEEAKIDPDFYLLTAQGRKAQNDFSIFLLFVVVLAFWGLSYVTAGREISIDADMSAETYCLLSILLLHFYNGERGYDSKPWRIVSYAYFPVHLAVIYLIFSLI